MTANEHEHFSSPKNKKRRKVDEVRKHGHYISQHELSRNCHHILREFMTSSFQPAWLLIGCWPLCVTLFDLRIQCSVWTTGRQVGLDREYRTSLIFTICEEIGGGETHSLTDLTLKGESGRKFRRMSNKKKVTLLLIIIWGESDIKSASLSYGRFRQCPGFHQNT